MLLTGSRAREGLPVDDLSDWDVILYVTDAEALVADDPRTVAENRWSGR